MKTPFYDNCLFNSRSFCELAYLNTEKMLSIPNLGWQSIFTIGTALSKLKEARIFKIPQDLATLFTLTDNYPKKETRLPFPTIFLETQIPIYGKYRDNDTKSVEEGDVYYDGLLLFEVPENFIDPISFAAPPNDIVLKYPNSRIRGFGYSRSNRFSPINDVYETYFWVNYPTGEDDKNSLYSLKELEQLRIFAANFIDFINDPEIITIKNTPNQRENEIRKRKNKPSRPISYEIELSNPLKLYIKQLRQGKSFNYSHRFWVRGHWRHYTNKRYINIRYKKQWIKPFIKGSGILVDNKNYILKKEE
jgi:hypothetical protein